MAIAGQASKAGRADARVLRVAAICGLVGQVGFVALWFAWGFIEKNYSVMRQDVSDFGALDASHPVPYNVILSVMGALTVVLAYGLYRALRPGTGALFGSLALAVMGAGQFLDGLLREDCAPSGSAACRDAADAGTLSWHHTAHDLESLVTIASVIVTPLALSFVFRKRPAWRGLAAYAAVSSAGTFALVAPYAILFATHDGSPVSGLLQRGAITVAVLFPAVVSGRLWQVAGEAG